MRGKVAGQDRKCQEPAKAIGARDQRQHQCGNCGAQARGIREVTPQDERRGDQQPEQGEWQRSGGKRQCVEQRQTILERKSKSPQKHQPFILRSRSFRRCATPDDLRREAQEKTAGGAQRRRGDHDGQDGTIHRQARTVLSGTPHERDGGQEQGCPVLEADRRKPIGSCPSEVGNVSASNDSEHEQGGCERGVGKRCTIFPFQGEPFAHPSQAGERRTEERQGDGRVRAGWGIPPEARREDGEQRAGVDEYVVPLEDAGNEEVNGVGHERHAQPGRGAEQGWTGNARGEASPQRQADESRPESPRHDLKGHDEPQTRGGIR